MNKKSLAKALTALGLVAVVGIGATMALFTDTTEEKTNTFTVGNVDIAIIEPNWNPDDGEDLYPGAEIEKDPIITNVGQNAGYIMMEVKGADKMFGGADPLFVSSYEENGVWNTAKWEYVGTAQTDPLGTIAVPQPTVLKDGYYVYKSGAEGLTAGVSTEPLFDKVTYLAAGTTVVSDIKGYFVKKTDATAAGTVTAADLVTEEMLSGAGGEHVDASELLTDAAGNYVIKYMIDGDAAGTIYDSAGDAEAAVRENSESSTTVFDLTVKGYAVQTKGAVYINEAGTAHPFVAEFVTP